MKRLLKLMGLTIGIGATLVCVPFVAVFLFPGILIQDGTLPWAARAVHAFDLGVTWKQGHWKAKSVSLWKKRLEVGFESICYSSSDPFIHACAKLEGSVVVDLWNKRVHVEKLEVPEAKFIGRSSPTVATQAQQPFDLFAFVGQIRSGWMRTVDWDHISISHVAILWREPAALLKAEANVQGGKLAQARTLAAALSGSYLEKTGNPTTLQGSAALTVPESGALIYQFGVDLGDAGKVIAAQTRGQLAEKSLSGTINARWAPRSAEIKQVSATSCKYSWLEKESPHAELECQLGADFFSDRPKTGPWARLFAKSKQPGKLEAALRASLDLPSGDVAKARGKLELEAAPNDAFGATTLLQVDADRTRSGDQALKLRGDIGIAEFDKLAGILDPTPWAVPAPLNRLGGKVTLHIEANGDTQMKKIQATLAANTALTSDSQNLNMEGKADLTMDALSRAHLNSEWKFGKTLLTLPRLDPTQLPRLFPDPQIVYPTKEKQESEFVFTSRTHIHTVPGSPLQFRSPEYATLIPLELNLLLDSKSEMTGYVRVPGFPVRVLNRDIRVKHVALTYPKSGSAELDAQVDFHYNDYDLTLSAFGKLDSPRYTLKSNPPLSENSAWALLLFGRPLEELSPGQGESLASAQSAVTNGAVSALSMYLLASTPVESIGYDPARGSFLATVKLGEGVSLRVEGVKEGVSSLGIRKRLGRNWVLNTYVEKVSATSDRKSVSTFLDWSRTY